MNSNQIKWAAILTMFVDHIGLFLFPGIMEFRLIGRLSFPLFAWLIANGAYHTHSITKYLVRLYIFALLSEIPFLLANRLLIPNFSGLDVLCTLFFGLVAVALIQRTTNKLYWLFITAIFAAFAQFLQTDYGGFGVCVIVVFYLFFTDFKQLVIAQTILVLTTFFLLPTYFSGLFEPMSLLALVMIYFYNNKPGFQTKYLFYVLYPAQYIIFYLLLKRLY
jgi:hypothetical protein